MKEFGRQECLCISRARKCAEEIIYLGEKNDPTKGFLLIEKAKKLFYRNKDFYNHFSVYNALISVVGNYPEYFDEAKSAFDEALSSGCFNDGTVAIWFEILINATLDYNNEKLSLAAKDFAEKAIKYGFFDARLCVGIIETLYHRSVADEDYKASKNYFEMCNKGKDIRLYVAMMNYAAKKVDFSFIIKKYEEAENKIKNVLSPLFMWAKNQHLFMLLPDLDCQESFVSRDEIKEPFLIRAMYTSGYLTRLENSYRPWNMWKSEKKSYERVIPASENERGVLCVKSG